jgi:hypothetical protein
MEAGGRAWVGRARKRRLGMGTRVHVIVTSVNPIEGLVDLALVEVEQGAAQASQGRRPQRSPNRSSQRKKGRG